MKKLLAIFCFLSAVFSWVEGLAQSHADTLIDQQIPASTTGSVPYKKLNPVLHQMILRADNPQYASPFNHVDSYGSAEIVGGSIEYDSIRATFGVNSYGPLSGSIALSPADPDSTKFRVDLLVINSTGTIAVLTGTAGQSPIESAFSASTQLPLYRIFVTTDGFSLEPYSGAIVQAATLTEVVAGLLTNKYVSPLTLHQYMIPYVYEVLSGITGGNNLVNGTGTNSLRQLGSTSSTGISAVSLGSINVVTGDYGTATGRGNTVSGFAATAQGAFNTASGTDAHAEGSNTFASAQYAHTEGASTQASGSAAHAGGQGQSTRLIIASGDHSFNHSYNSTSQVSGHGVLADNAAILGGVDHHIPSTSPRSVILGGTTISIPASRPDEVWVPSLAINTAPTTDTGTLNALVYDPTTKLVMQRAISGGGGTTSPLTTKGDLWGYSTTNARLPVGTDGYALLANSSTSTGLLWTDLSSLYLTPTQLQNTGWTFTDYQYHNNTFSMWTDGASNSLQIDVNGFVNTYGATAGHTVSFGTPTAFRNITFPDADGTLALLSDITGGGALPSQTGNSGKYLTTNGTAASWGTVSSGTTSPLTTKGDLYTYSTTQARLPVGTNGYALLANSSQTTGLIWSDLSTVYFPLSGGSITGTGGAGYIGLIPQSSAPSTPGSGFRLYATSAGKLAWKGTNGFVRTFDGTANTADRSYKLQNADMTLADSAAVAANTNAITLTQQSHTTGTTVTITSASGPLWLIINPASVLASVTVTLPLTPVDGQRVEISFGGTMTTGTVVTALTISPNTSQAILQATTPSTAEAGEVIAYRWKSSVSKWYRLN